MDQGLLHGRRVLLYVFVKSQSVENRDWSCQTCRRAVGHKSWNAEVIREGHMWRLWRQWWGLGSCFPLALWYHGLFGWKVRCYNLQGDRESCTSVKAKSVLAWNKIALSACQVCLKPRVFDIKSTPPPKGFKDRLMQAQISTAMRVARAFMWLQSPASWRVSAECHPGWQKRRPEGWTPHDKDWRFVYQKMMTD